MNSFAAKKWITLLITLTLVIACAFVFSMETASAVSSPKAGTYKILITKKTKPCTLTVFKDMGDGWKPIRTCVCAVGVEGSRSNATKTGTTKIKGKRLWFHMTNEGFGIDCWTRYNNRIWPDAYIHSPSYNGKNKALCRNRYQKTLGKHATHGCCRVNVMMARWIFINCRKGTEVIVDNSITDFDDVKFSKKYKSMGKPHKVKYKNTNGHAWEPTDPDAKNPYFTLQPTQILIAKDKDTDRPIGVYKHTFKKVYAIDPNASGSRGAKYNKSGSLIYKKKVSSKKIEKKMGLSIVNAENRKHQDYLSIKEAQLMVKVKNSKGKWIVGGKSYKAYETPDKIKITKPGKYTFYYYIVNQYTMMRGTAGAKADEKAVKKKFVVTFYDRTMEITGTDSVKTNIMKAFPKTTTKTITKSYDPFSGVKAKGVTGKNRSKYLKVKIVEKNKSTGKTTTTKLNYTDGKTYKFKQNCTYTLTYSGKANKKKCIYASKPDVNQKVTFTTPAKAKTKPAVAANKTIVTYDLNGAEGTAPAKQTVTYGTSAKAPIPTLGENQTFLSWNTKADGSGTKIEAGAEGTELKSMWKTEKTVTLYAQWKDATSTDEPPSSPSSIDEPQEEEQPAAQPEGTEDEVQEPVAEPVTEESEEAEPEGEAA